VNASNEVYANFAPIPNPARTLVFAETFEDYPACLSLAGTNGWQADSEDAIVVSTRSDLIDGVAAYGLSHAYPVNTTHSQVGFSEQDVSLNVVSASNSIVITKILLKMSPHQGTPVPESSEIPSQLKVIFSEIGELMLLHGTPATSIARWSTFSGTIYDADTWHTITLEQDYQTVGQGCRYFRISVDNGSWLTHANGYSANDETGSPGGHWFAFANTSPTRMNRIRFQGTVGVDDVLISESWTGQGGRGDGNNNGMWDFWEYQYFGGTNQSGGEATADWDGDGFDNLSEWLADTDPTDPNSSLTIKGLALEPGGLKTFWQGGRAATQYLETSENLNTGSWQPIYTNQPPTEILNEFMDSNPMVPNLFYRIRAVRE